MKFHITSSLPKPLHFAKSILFAALIGPLVLVSCKEGKAAEEEPLKAEVVKKVSPLEQEIERMFLTKKYDPKKVEKLIQGKTWKELLSLCMKKEKSLSPSPEKERIVWVRLKLRGSFFDAEKEANLRRLKEGLRQMAEKEELVVPD